ncbi:unnamed protein product [Vitrella brassicaformis CCMP3155]|uniref:Protein kinase domain-containing protein n=1 Tax=Vitrella brassicaformis (strain CCMP3155) TaxID=1169540 RepID=A0A0G4EDS9_VITBC|nr:unnamed protein product [Vitrella brassicaformis CCMP3155]|eukprot:CEL93687.1 unnamed protein product [Vitrella brassicaformis CCMP3155]
MAMARECTQGTLRLQMKAPYEQLDEQTEHRTAQAVMWLMAHRGFKLDFLVTPRRGRFGTVVAMRDSDGRRWAVKLMSHSETDANAQVVNGWFRAGNDLWIEDCQQRASQPYPIQPPPTIVRCRAVYHIPGPYTTLGGERVEGVTAYQLEWIDRTLHELRGPLSEAALTAIAEGVVRAVGYLGLCGLIHGDIHAGNIGVRVRQAVNPTTTTSTTTSSAARDRKIRDGDGDSDEYEAVLLDLDRLHRENGKDRFSFPEINNALAPHGQEQQPRPGMLSHGRDMYDAVHWLIQSLKRLDAPRRLTAVFEDVLAISERQPAVCLSQILSKLRALRKSTKAPPKPSAAACGTENRKTPPLSPPSLRLPGHFTPQLDPTRPTICNTRGAPPAPLPTHRDGPGFAVSGAVPPFAPTPLCPACSPPLPHTNTRPPPAAAAPAMMPYPPLCAQYGKSPATHHHYNRGGTRPPSPPPMKAQQGARLRRGQQRAAEAAREAAEGARKLAQQIREEQRQWEEASQAPAVPVPYRPPLQGHPHAQAAAPAPRQPQPPPMAAIHPPPMMPVPPMALIPPVHVPGMGHGPCLRAPPPVPGMLPLPPHHHHYGVPTPPQESEAAAGWRWFLGLFRRG